MVKVKSTVTEAPGAIGVFWLTSSALRIELSPPPGGSSNGGFSVSEDDDCAAKFALAELLLVIRSVTRNCSRSTLTGVPDGKVPGHRLNGGAGPEQLVSLRLNVTVLREMTRFGKLFSAEFGSTRVDCRMLLCTVGERRLCGAGAPRTGLPEPTVASTARSLKS